MCRDRNHGGRRCPCDQPERRAAIRKARRAARATLNPTTEAPGTHHDATQPLSPERIQELTALINTAYSTSPEAEAARAQLTRDHGSPIGAIIAIGATIRDEGERRAGINLAAERDVLRQEVSALQRVTTAADSQLMSARRHLQTVIDTATGSLAERKALLDQARQQQQPVIAAATQQKDTTRARNTDLNAHLTRTRTALADGYAEALAQVRPLGGEVAFEGRTSAKARAAFAEASAVYPSAWLEASGALPAPYAAVTKSRAHYSRGTVKVRSTRGPDVLTMQVPTDDVDRYCKDNSTPTEELTPDTERAAAEEAVQGYAFVKLTSYDVHHDWWRSGNPPKGRGWEPYDDGSGVPTFRRVKTRTTSSEVNVVPELRTNVSTRAYVEGRSDTYATSVHELAHRMEHAVPQIAAMERDFLTHRTTTAEGREEPTSIYAHLKGANAEYGYADHFATHYSGRVYSDDGPHGHDDGHHYELLSTGMESVFAGRYGAQAGLGDTPDQYAVDDEYRAFTLGVLATAQPTRVL